MAKIQNAYGDYEIKVKVPKKEVVRVRWLKDGRILIDFRGIRIPKKESKKRYNQAFNRRFTSPAELEALCNEYFESCVGPLRNKFGEFVRDDKGKIVMVQVKPYTISGLAFYLGLSTKTLHRYGSGDLDDLGFDIDHDAQFSSVIRRARQQIEIYAESRLYDKDGFNGGKLVLDCAFGWLSSKEQAEILEKRVAAEVRRRELEMKEELLRSGEVVEDFSIKIVRGEKPDASS